MSNWSTFTLPFEGLELPRFLLTLEQSLAAFPGARITFVELDAADDPDEPLCGIEISLSRALVEQHRAPEDPELPEGEDTPSAEITLSAEGEETTLAVDLERNAYVMPVLVKIVEDVLRRLEVIDEDESEDEEDEDEEFDEDEDEDLEDEDEEDVDEDEDEDEDEEDVDEDEADEEETEDEVGEAFEALRVVAARTFGAIEGDETSFSLTVSWEEPPRKKGVRVRAFEPAFAAGEGEGASWVALECEVCPLSALPPAEAVGINTAADFQMSLDGETYLLTTSYPVRALDASLFLEITLALAEQADILGLAIEEGKLARS
ncbi:hypothetical protein KEG38_14685 [Polyangium jinanense]|uniref:hypothetical protein n=1 Tax=Polyangium jinanense TaxID=2829994 RepID=UPI0023416F52|nr:hypothetical protein [Polyangium jinanense]MDC3955109.1 hypothetical protein [Polyangium jinanense]